MATKSTKKLWTLEHYGSGVRTKSFKTQAEAVKAVKAFALKAYSKAVKVSRISTTLWLAEDSTGYGVAIRLSKLREEDQS
jgi:inosine/xanthosine triphosphate pyrophosphatase family protein